MAVREFSANSLQTINANGVVIFENEPVPGNGLIFHRDESGIFRLGNRYFMQNRCLYCRRSAFYRVSFGANIQVPTGGTAEEIGVSIFVDGEEDPSSRMLYTPAAVENFGNISTSIVVEVPWMCSCSSVSVRSVSSQAIQAQNVNLIIEELVR